MKNLITKKPVLLYVSLFSFIFMLFVSSCEREEIRPTEIKETKQLTMIDISPRIGAAGDIIQITGTNFSPVPFNNKVRFNGDDALGRVSNSAFLMGDTEIGTLTVRVPLNATTGPVSISLADQTIIADFDFQVLSTISSFSPSVGRVGSSVTVYGSNFNSNASENEVLFNGVSATITDAKPNSLTVIVPDGVTTAAITVNSNGQSVTSSANFEVLDVETTTITIRVRHDVEQHDSGVMEGDDETLNMGTFDSRGGNQAMGFHFGSVQIPTGATISKASLQLVAEEPGAESTEMTVHVENEGAASIFGVRSYELTIRRSLTEGVVWRIPEWKSIGDALPAQRTPDLADLVQQVINDPDWVNGNNMNFILIPSGPSENISDGSLNEGRKAFALENELYESPHFQVVTELTIEYY